MLLTVMDSSIMCMWSSGMRSGAWFCKLQLTPEIRLWNCCKQVVKHGRVCRKSTVKIYIYINMSLSRNHDPVTQDHTQNLLRAASFSLYWTTPYHHAEINLHLLTYKTSVSVTVQDVNINGILLGWALTFKSLVSYLLRTRVPSSFI